jgi:AbiU2
VTDSDEAAKAAAKAERILTAARAAWLEAIDLCSCIETLEAGNQPEVLSAIRDAKAHHAADLVQRAFFGRLLMEVMTAFDPVREGDFHLKVGMDLIAEEIPRLVVLQRGAGAGDLNKIEAAERHWDECKKFEPLEPLRIYRNKYVAHLSDPPAGMEDPLVAELFTLSRMVAKVAEALAHGTGIAAVSLESQVSVFRDSARAFWGKWLGH